jgi:ABC-type multidrug transport system ATPase subunit
MNNDVLLSMEHISKSYGSFTAVDDVSLEISRGKVFGFLGPNGAGKSTTLRMILSLIYPSNGTINIFGKNLKEHREEILSKIGSIIEKPDFYNYLSAYQNIFLLAKLSNLSLSKNDIFTLLERVGLKGREDDLVKNYSHGMKQRLGLAHSLAANPELIILDEPTTGLDPQGIIDLRNLILELKEEHGKTIILSSHILSEIELIADDMVIMNKGKVKVQGSVSALLSNENLTVTIEADDIELVNNIILDSSWSVNFRNQDDNFFHFNMSKNEIPNFISYISSKTDNIYSITYKRTLEDFFLKLTNQ